MAEAIRDIGESLAWGHGSRLLEVFLEPTCPHSARAFGKLMPLLDLVGEDRLTIRIHLQSQPWHLFSPLVTRAILAVSLAKGGKDAAFRVMDEVFRHRGEFIAEDHCRGENMEASLADILRRLEEHSGLEIRDVFENKAATDLMKRHARFARQNGIHASPTFMVDGLVNEKMSSGDDVETWAAQLGLGGS